LENNSLPIRFSMREVGEEWNESSSRDLCFSDTKFHKTGLPTRGLEEIRTGSGEYEG
jgi:hypothetical protein